MSKTKLSLYNSFSSLLLTFINSLYSLIIARKIIEIYGSDFNGLNSTASQFINILLIIEGGFATAANVALFEPLSFGKIEEVNGILSAVRIKFNKLGNIFLLLSTIACFIFAAFVKSNLPYYIKFSTFMMLAISTYVNLTIATKYRVLIQSDQKEYIITFASIICSFISYILMYIGILLKWPMLALRAIVMVFSIISSICIVIICKKEYKYIKTNEKPNFKSIKGTSDVFVQKITGVIYFAAPTLAISIFVNTTAASVYALYNTIFILIRSLENAIINSPRMSLGRLIAEEGEKSDHIKNVFNEYEFILIITISLMLSVATVMIMPFVKFYAKNFKDISYINWRIALALIIICYVECIHIPSGNFIIMSGHFKDGKNIQLIAGGILVVSVILGGVFWGMDGVLLSVLITAIVIAVLEIRYVQKNIFLNKNKKLIKTLIVNSITSIILVALELNLHANINSITCFFIYLFIFSLINATILVLANFKFNNEIATRCYKRVKHIMNK